MHKTNKNKEPSSSSKMHLHTSKVQSFDFWFAHTNNHTAKLAREREHSKLPEEVKTGSQNTQRLI